ncbi:MAG: glycosyltransferase family 39 protein [Candidatus Paceibacterota bacterium]
MPKWLFNLLFSFILLFGIIVRFYHLGKIPVSLYWDETAILVDARSIAATGHDIHGNPWLSAIFPSYGDYKLPVYIWLASLSVKLWGASNWALRLPSALAGIATIFVGGALASQLASFEKKLNRRAIFLWTALIIALTPWSILFSRTGFEGHVGQLLLAISIWLALKTKKHWGWGLAAALLGGLATYTYFSIRFVWPVVFITAVCLFNTPERKNFIRWFGLSLILPLLLFTVSLWPMYRSPFYEISNQFRLSATSVLNMADWPVESNQYKLLAGNTLFDKLVYHPKVLLVRELAKNYVDNLSADFLFFTGDPNLRHGTGRHGLFLTIFILPFVYGWFILFTKHWRVGTLLLVWWLAALLPASVPETTPHALRSLNALVPLAIVIGWGCAAGWQAIKQSTWPLLLKLSIQLGLLLVLALSTFDFTSFYFLTYPKLSASEWQTGFADLAHEAWQQSQEMDVVWIQPFDSRFYLWLMAYEMPVEDFDKIEFDQYMPDHINNIRFRWFDWGKLPTLSEKTVLIARKDFIDWQLETIASRQPNWYKIFYTADNRPEYAAIYFEKVK